MERQLSAEQKQQRVNILSKLHKQPISINLQAYFKRLEEGSPAWNIETFIKGATQFADLNGPERAKCYENPIMGLHYPTSFTELWNIKYPQHPITTWDQDFRRQCPPSWSSELRAGLTYWVLSYQGEAPLSQGLNELLQGPTTLDCGMFCQLLLWMAIRYLIGDAMFDKVFGFEKGQFILTQNWIDSMNIARSDGNLLHRFYDNPLLKQTSDPPESTTRIQTRTVYNHPKYLAKHPGGMGKLHNITQIDEFNIVFKPGARRNILSDSELDQHFMQLYNAPQDPADLQKLRLYTSFPDFVYSDFAPETFGTLAREAKERADHTFDETEWRDSQAEREKEADGMHRPFNFERLIEFLRK
jgi:hypothetical protein